MKVKITYTADYEEVPDIVQDLLKQCRRKLARASELRFDTRNLVEAAREVATVQTQMEIVSAQLDDCVSLMHGYNTVQNQEPHEQTLSSQEASNSEENSEKNE